jgi:DNA-binding PadR family transcriptional regulator
MANRPAKDRSGDVARIALLGVLERRPTHGYDVKATLKRWSMDWWADVQSGSIYSGLRKLEQDGLATVKETGRNGKRPVHRVYEITDAGREELRNLLRGAWLGITRFSRPIDLAVAFYDVLSRKEIEKLLKERLNNLAVLHRAFDPDQAPPLTGSAAQHAVVADLRDHEQRLIASEIEWTQSLLERLKSSVYPPSYPREQTNKGKGKNR